MSAVSLTHSRSAELGKIIFLSAANSAELVAEGRVEEVRQVPSMGLIVLLLTREWHSSLMSG